MYLKDLLFFELFIVPPRRSCPNCAAWSGSSSCPIVVSDDELRPSTRLRLRRVFWGDEQSTSENDSGSESSEVAGLSGATGSSSPAVLFQSCFKGACSRNEINENN